MATRTVEDRLAEWVVHTHCKAYGADAEEINDPNRMPVETRIAVRLKQLCEAVYRQGQIDAGGLWMSDRAIEKALDRIQEANRDSVGHTDESQAG